MEYSPALSANSDLTEEELEKYFQTYIPLSNLPTPPPAKEHAIPATPRSMASSPFLQSTPGPFPVELQAQAIHLGNLVPSNVSTHCDVHVLCGFLQRANLPEEVVAFAACVLDMLSAQFSTRWRQDVDVAHAAFERASKTSNISPDIIVLAALALAHGFCIDRHRSSRHWAVKESAGMFSVREIETAKRAMLRDIDYGLFRVGEERVSSMRLDMQRRGGRAGRRRTLEIKMAGTAVWSLGVQTPEPSP